MCTLHKPQSFKCFQSSPPTNILIFKQYLKLHYPNLHDVTSVMFKVNTEQNIEGSPLYFPNVSITTISTHSKWICATLTLLRWFNLFQLLQVSKFIFISPCALTSTPPTNHLVGIWLEHGLLYFGTLTI